jgi:hypothetical protein
VQDFPAVGNHVDATLMYLATFQECLFHSIVWIYVLLYPILENIFFDFYPKWK